MKNLIWQYHIDTNRAYDSPHRKNMAMASAETVLFYAMKYGVNYEMGHHSKWWVRGMHGGPAMERFQLIEKKYDEWDYILYIDTDILITPEAPDIFEVYRGADLAGINMGHQRDQTLLKEGWLKSEFPDPNQYHENYTNGAILLMSRDFRQYLRGVLKVSDIQVDKGTNWDRDGIKVRWPVYDQSMVSYWLAMSSFSLTPIDKSWVYGPYFINHGGPKTPENLKRYFNRYRDIRELWLASDYNV